MILQKSAGSEDTPFLNEINMIPLIDVSLIIEKPTVAVAREKLHVNDLPADTWLGWFGMHLLAPGIYDILEEMIRDNLRDNGEFQLTRAQELQRQRVVLLLSDSFFVPTRVIENYERLRLLRQRGQQGPDQFLAWVGRECIQLRHELGSPAWRQVVYAEMEECAPVRDRPFGRNGRIAPFRQHPHEQRGVDVVVIGKRDEGPKSQLLNLAALYGERLSRTERRSPPGVAIIEVAPVPLPIAPFLSTDQFPQNRDPGAQARDEVEAFFRV